MPAFNAVGMDAIALSVSTGGAAVPSDPSVVVGVTISPSAATLSGGTTQQFSGAVLGLNNPSQALTWSAPAGSVDANGLFTAPATTSDHQYINVTATSDQDPSKSATASVVIPGSSPRTASGIFQCRRRGARRVQRFS